MFPLKGDVAFWTTYFSPGPGGCTQVWGNPNPGYPNGRHNGIDLGCATGTAVYACWEGQVVKADYDTGYGRHVRILHPNGCLSLYGHLSKIEVSVGQHLSDGEYLGLSGGGLEDAQRGQSTGPHLHFEVRSNPYDAKTNVDPVAWLKTMEEGAVLVLPPLTGKVQVTASPWVRVRYQPGLQQRVVGHMYTGEILEVAPGVAPAKLADIEWTPIIFWVARTQKGEGEYLKQLT